MNDEYESALVAELGVTDTKDVTPPAPTPEDDGSAKTPEPPKAETEDKEQVPPAKPEAGEPVDPQGGEEKEETAEEKANREGEEAVKPLSAEDIRKAIAEDRSEVQSRLSNIESARDEVIEKLYPEGIDKTIYDSNGNAIKTAQDIVDRGLLKENGEPYTYEEAASFILEANRQMTENITELNKYAENIAEVNISLKESSERVMSKWGDLLKAQPELAKELSQDFLDTLTFDKSNSYITEMKITPERFYDRVLAPYQKLQEAEAAQAAKDAEAEEKRKQEEAEAEQDERSGLPPQRGTSKSKANTGREDLDAFIDELNKG